jgi:hypothetical protein
MRESETAMPGWFRGLSAAYIFVALLLTARMAMSSNIATIEHSGWYLMFLTFPSCILFGAIAVAMGNLYDSLGGAYLFGPLGACLNVLLFRRTLAWLGRLGSPPTSEST